MLWKCFEFKDDNESQNDATCKQCVSDNKSNKYLFRKIKKIRIVLPSSTGSLMIGTTWATEWIPVGDVVYDQHSL